VANFIPQYLILQIFLFIILLLLREKKSVIIIFLFFILINFIPLLYLYIPVEKKEVRSEITILLANVYTNNQNYGLFSSYIKEVNPDIISLLEIDSRWVEHLKLFEDDYYVLKEPRPDNFGIALYSRFPFSSGEIIPSGPLDVPTINCTVTVEGKEIRIIATHPMPPRNKAHMEFRDEHLMEIANTIRGQEDVILLGDLNLTPWAHTFHKILEISSLKDTRKGFGLQPTWPTYNSLFLIPIDHCLVDKDFVVLNRETGPYTGSDHYPVVIKLGW